MSAYGSMMLYSNEKLLGSNNTGLGAHPSLNSSGLHGMNQEDALLSRSYQPLSTSGGNAGGNNAPGAANMPGGDQGEDNARATPLGRSYAKFDRLRRGQPLLARPPPQQQLKLSQLSQPSQQSVSAHRLNSSLYHPSKNPARPPRRSRHTSYINDTNSEQMANHATGSHNELFNSCTFDRLSEENFNFCGGKRTEGGGERRGDERRVESYGEGSACNGAERAASANRSAPPHVQVTPNVQATPNPRVASNGSHKFSRLLRNDGMTNHQQESNQVDLRNVSTPMKYSEGRPFAVGFSSTMGPVGSVLKGAPPNEARNGRGESRLPAATRLDSAEGDSEDDYYQRVVRNISNCSSEEKDMSALLENVENLNNYVLNMERENEHLNEILQTNNSISETVRCIQQVVLTRKKVIQDRRNVINEEYELISQKLKECESFFCDSNDGGKGEKKLKVFYEIDEKKNTLKGKYEMKKMLLKKAEYKIEKLQEYTDAVKMKTLAISERYKKTFLLIEELFRLKIIKDTENELEVCLIPKNTKTNMWHKLQLDKREMTSDACDYLWSQIESFVDRDALNGYL